MKKNIILFAVLMVFIEGVSHASSFNYTWKDADGTLNVTDYPPPENVEIIDISIIPVPKKKQIAPAPDLLQQKKLQKQNEAQKRILAKAEELRGEETVLRRNASTLMDEAQEQRRLSKLHKYKERYRRRASNKEREAKDITSQADSLARKAETLERKASKLNQ